MINLADPTLLRLLSARDASDGVSSDTRAELKGMMFVALKGANFDGNTFVKHALNQGRPTPSPRIGNGKALPTSQ